LKVAPIKVIISLFNLPEDRGDSDPIDQSPLSFVEGSTGYRGISLIRNTSLLGLYSRTMLRVLG
jgi:hypothetical protein